MPDSFSAFLENPGGETFRALRAVLISQPEFDFQATDLAEVQALAGQEDSAGVLERGGDAMPNWLLSPSMHQYLSEAAEDEGDDERAAQEEYLVKACLRGLLESGDGTLVRPYLITHPADEYDLIEMLGKDVARQEMLETNAPPLDRIRCTDGTELHFDLSPGLPQDVSFAG